MGIKLTLPALAQDYSLEMLKEEVTSLLERGMINRNQPLYILCEYLPAREWCGIECLLERFDYLLRDRVGDLIGEPKWDND